MSARPERATASAAWRRPVRQAALVSRRSVAAPVVVADDDPLVHVGLRNRVEAAELWRCRLGFLDLAGSVDPVDPIDRLGRAGCRPRLPQPGPAAMARSTSTAMSSSGGRGA